VLIVTEYWRQRLLKRSVEEEKCSVVMNLPDEKIFKPIDKRRRSGFKLIYHGTLVHRYGVDIIIKAISILKEIIPEIELNIIGEGEELDSLIKLASKLSLKNIYFSKKFIPVTEIPQIIGNMDVGIVPNRINNFTKEILNAKLLEYVAMEVPVIVSRTPGIEYYFDDSMVVFFEPENENELAQKILWLYNEPNRREVLAKNAKKFFITYNWKQEGEKYYSIINNLKT
jgi:glycosyltransferase involved in cell wall biosynthesis